MKNYKNIVVGSLLVMAIVASPAISFAKENEKSKGNEKQEQNMKSSWWSSWFNNKSSNNVSTTPTISNLKIESTKGTKAIIKWDTDVRSNSMVWYSTTSPVDTTSNPSMKRGDRVLKHKFEIKKLLPNTTYYVVAGGATAGGTGKSAEMPFTTGTTTRSETMPVISSVTGQASAKTNETLTYTLTASDPQNKTLTYSIDWADGSKVAETSFTGSVTVTHAYSTAGTYVAKFTVTNSDGKKANYPVKIVITGTDTTAPVISEIETKVSGTNATISWKTNELSTSTVFYSQTTPLDTATATKVENNSLVTKHSISIPNLSSNTLYHFIIKSVDGSNNASSSSEATFSTN